MTEVVVAVTGAWEPELVARLDGCRGARVIRRCPDLADLLATAAAGLGDLAVISADLRGLDRDALDHLKRAGLAVIGATADPDEASERRLRQLGIATVIRPATDDAELLLALEREPREHPGDADHLAPPGKSAEPGSDGSQIPGSEDLDEPIARGQIVAVWGPTGAPGRTTVAINLAAEAAELGASVLLLDLDTYGASIAQALAMMDEAPGVAAAARASELGTLDLLTLARLAPEVTPRLRVLTGIPTPERWPELRVGAIEQILALGRSLAELVVIDCGFGIEDDEELSYDTTAPRRNATTLTALAEADRLLVIGQADPIGLHRLVRAIQATGTIASAEPEVVVTKVRASAVGPSPGRRVSEALDRFAGVSEVTLLPDDAEALDRALLAGGTLGEHAPSSPLRAALTALAAQISGRQDSGSTRRRQGGRRRAP